jgi:hypothetical protein
MPTAAENDRAFTRLRLEWDTPTRSDELPRTVPPSRELFEEAVTRANRDRYVGAESVTTSLLAGRWPERTER